jgi:hypothetical protein
MANCPKCGKKNDDDAAFCTNCGTSLRSDVGSTIEQRAKQFAQDMEQMGKKAGERMAQSAKQFHETTQEKARQFELRMDQAGHQTENWYDRTFGIFGPLLSSFVFLIVFRIALLVMQLPSVKPAEINTVAVILIPYVLPLFAVTLLSNYTSYFAKKYFKFRVFSPLFYAVIIVLVLWIVSRILFDASIRFSTVDLRTGAVSLENSLPTIFVFVVLLGYVILALNMPRHEEKK